METKPSIVFAHGIWADGSSFSKVVPALQPEGYEVICSQHSLDTVKGDDLELGAAITMESLAFASLFSTKDQQEGVSAFLEKRQPLFTGE